MGGDLSKLSEGVGSESGKGGKPRKGTLINGLLLRAAGAQFSEGPLTALEKASGLSH